MTKIPMKIPEKLWRVSSESTKNLVYLCHYDTDEGFEKRATTGRNWARGYKNLAVNEHIFDNDPQEGFEVVKNVSRWSTSNVVWRIIDPRGFELEIYSGNMMALIENTVIDHGIIQGKCVWARDGSKNVLLPIGSELYTKAVQATKLVSKKPIPINSVIPGSVVRIKNMEDTPLVYVGKYYDLKFNGYYNELEFYTFFTGQDKNKRYRKYHFFYDRETNGFLTRTSPSIVDVQPKMPISWENVVALIKESLNKKLENEQTKYESWGTGHIPGILSFGDIPWNEKITEESNYDSILKTFDMEFLPWVVAQYGWYNNWGKQIGKTKIVYSLMKREYWENNYKDETEIGNNRH